MKKNIFKISLMISLVLIIISPVMVFAQQTYFPSAEECAGFRENNMISMEPYCSYLTQTPPAGNEQPQPQPQSFFCEIGNNPKFQNLINYVTCVISTSVIPLIFALALVTFIWGVVQFVINSDDEAKKTKGKQFMIWGIIALAVMVSVWGLVGILLNTFNVDGTFIPQVRP